MSVFRGGFFFAIGTLLSRISGLVREAVLAGVFGASAGMDAFLIANRLPNMLRELVAEGALGASFTKRFSELWESSRQRALQLVADVSAAIALAGAALIAAAWWGAPHLVAALTVGLPDGPEGGVLAREAAALTRVIFPFIVIMAAAAVAAGALHTRGRFFASAVAPLGLNGGYILGATVFGIVAAAFLPASWDETLCDRRLLGLACGVLVGGGIQLALLVVSGWKDVWRPAFARLRRPRWTEDTRAVLALMLPMVLAAGAGQINVLVNTNFATSLGTGAVSWLSYAFRLVQLPIALIAVALGAALLPELARIEAAERGKAMGRALTGLLWVLLPCAVMLVVHPLAMVQLLYQHGSFSPDDAAATATALRTYGAGVLGFGVIKVATAFYYALDRTSFAMRVSLAGIAVNLCANALLVQELGFAGLAAATSVLMTVNGAWLLWGVRSHLRDYPWRRPLVAWLGASALGTVGAVTIGRGAVLVPWGYKGQALVELALGGALVLASFVLAACWCYRKSPRTLFRLSIEMRKTKA